MFKMRQVIAVILMTVSAYTDLKERNIYIAPIVVSLAASLIMTIMTDIYLLTSGQQKGPFFNINEYILYPVIASVIIMIFTYIFRKSIGEGDGYLIASLGFVLGIKCTFSIIVISCMSCSIVSIGICIFNLVKRIRLKESGFGESISIRLPFAPFIMFAYILGELIKIV